MNCPHPERPNVLSLPSMGNPHCCRECLDAQVRTPFQGKREAWDHAGYDHKAIGDTHYTRGTGGYFVQDGNADNERRWK